MYQTVFENYFGAWNPSRMPPKRCERVGCDALATVVGVANHANWYLCDSCASMPGVKVEAAIRPTPPAPDAAEMPAEDAPGTTRGAGEASR